MICEVIIKASTHRWCQFAFLLQVASSLQFLHGSQVHVQVALSAECAYGMRSPAWSSS
jgi:hypothetical protein